VWQVWNRTKIKCRLECDTHKNVRANRIKITKTKTCAGVGTAQKNNEKILASDVFKVERCGSSLLTSNRKIEFEKKLMISKRNHKRKKCCESCSRWSVHCKISKQNQLKERATSAGGCRRVSVQYKGYNLIRVTTVEVSATRDTTALVYCLINSSLYTGTVQR
jgi:hypothetical protein